MPLAWIRPNGRRFLWADGGENADAGRSEAPMSTRADMMIGIACFFPRATTLFILDGEDEHVKKNQRKKKPFGRAIFGFWGNLGVI
jgi:hypothetical protein